MNRHPNGTIVVGVPGSLARLHSETVDAILGKELELKALCETLLKTQAGSDSRNRVLAELENVVFYSSYLTRKLVQIEDELSKPLSEK